MHIWDSLNGRVKCRIVSASLTGFLSNITQRCNVQKIDIVDDLTASFYIFRKDLVMVTDIAENRGDILKVIKTEGVYWTIIGLLRRPVLVFGICMFLFLVFYLPTRVLFVGVEGNRLVPATRILEAAQSCGICFGAPREQVRSERVKNSLLQALPQLQWACVNTRGCVAIVSVQERNTKNSEKTQGACDIVASRDGIITEMTVHKGSALCQVGQAVKKDQILVSGYTDLGLVVKAGRADAEVSAETQRYLTVSALTDIVSRQSVVRTENRYSFMIGKKVINFDKCSGISPAGCGRMYLESYATLPGGFRLPMALVVEQVTYYDTENVTVSNDEHFAWLKDAARQIVRQEMVAGEILDSDTSLQLSDGVCDLFAGYRCREVIGCVRNEETVIDYGKRN